MEYSLEPQVAKGVAYTRTNPISMVRDQWFGTAQIFSMHVFVVFVAIVMKSGNEHMKQVYLQSANQQRDVKTIGIVELALAILAASHI